MSIKIEEIKKLIKDEIPDANIDIKDLVGDTTIQQQLNLRYLRD